MVYQLLSQPLKYLLRFDCYFWQIRSIHFFTVNTIFKVGIGQAGISTYDPSVIKRNSDLSFASLTLCPHPSTPAEGWAAAIGCYVVPRPLRCSIWAVVILRAVTSLFRPAVRSMYRGTSLERGEGWRKKYAELSQANIKGSKAALCTRGEGERGGIP